MRPSGYSVITAPQSPTQQTTQSELTMALHDAGLELVPAFLLNARTGRRWWHKRVVRKIHSPTSLCQSANQRAGTLRVTTGL